jgi:hypothetical protein
VALRYGFQCWYAAISGADSNQWQTLNSTDQVVFCPHCPTLPRAYTGVRKHPKRGGSVTQLTNCPTLINASRAPQVLWLGCVMDGDRTRDVWARGKGPRLPRIGPGPWCREIPKAKTAASVR